MWLYSCSFLLGALFVLDDVRLESMEQPRQRNQASFHDSVVPEIVEWKVWRGLAFVFFKNDFLSFLAHLLDNSFVVPVLRSAFLVDLKIGC